MEPIQVGEDFANLPVLSEALRKLRHYTLQQTHPNKINKFTNKHPGLRVFYLDNFTSASPKTQSIIFGLLEGKTRYVEYENKSHQLNLNNSIIIIGVHEESLQVDNKTIGFHQVAHQKRHVFGEHKHFAKHSIDFTIGEQEKREQSLSELFRNEITHLITTHHKGIQTVRVGERLLENFTKNYIALSKQQRHLLKISLHEEIGAVLKNNKNLQGVGILLEQDSEKNPIQVSLLRDLPNSQE